MKKKILYILMTAAVLTLFSACARRDAVEYTALSRTFSGIEEEEQEEDGEEQETPGAEENEKAADGQTETETGEAMQPAVLYVDISGAVVQPGVYRLEDGSRVFQAVEAAGGFLPDAETRCVNQADLLSDGEKLYIYSMAEAEQLGGWLQISGKGDMQKSPADGGAGDAAADTAAADTGGRVNLNQADKSQLMTLPGVGEARAAAIIEYRETNGAFSAAEDIMKIPGIKEKLFQQIQDKITV